jgi:hypothetical protein
MRALLSASVFLLPLLSNLAACSSSEGAGAEAARLEAEAEAKKKAAQPSTAKKVSPPVAGRANISCDQLIDLPGFAAALGEKEPLTVKDVTKSQAEATASCSLVRGGKRPSPAEQERMLEKSRRLGVLPGDELCGVTAFCWTVEEEDHFKRRCKEQGFQDDESLGFYACLQIVATGANDVFSFRILDSDTKCVLQVRGGPSLVDNAVISTCAKAATDLIGPPQITPGATADEPAAEPSAPAAE